MWRIYDSAVAVEYGICTAVLLWYFREIQNGPEHKSRTYRNRLWIPIRNLETLHKMFPEFSKTAIKNSITKMRERHLLVKGDFNLPEYDGFFVYSLTDLGLMMAGEKHAKRE